MLTLYKELWIALKKQKLILATNLAAVCIFAISGPFSLYAHAYFINKVEDVIRMDVELGSLIYPAVLLLVSFLLPVSKVVSDYLNLKVDYFSNVSWNKKMNEMIKKIPYWQYEHEETYDKVKQVADNNLYSLIIACGFLTVSMSISIILYVLLLVRISFWLMVSVIILAPVVGYFSSKAADKQYKKIFRQMKGRRHCLYKSSIFRSREYAKEIRVNGCTEYMVNDWLGRQKEVDSKSLRIKFKYGFLNALIVKTEYIIIFINLIIVLSAYFNGHITLGIFISVSNQIFSMRLLSKMQTIISQATTIRNVRKLYEEAEEIMTKNCGADHIDDARIIIEFDNVSFKYPDCKEYVLKNVNLKINAGESVAIVGENGAGKSTFIKLLLGLYSPSEGKVLVNGAEVTGLSLAERARVFGVAFQDYSKFCLTLKENLALDEEPIGVPEVIRNLGIGSLAGSLSNGYDTLLGKSFGKGVDISGGQWQSIAIARAMIRNKKVFIFDEPTASLDPVSEVRVFDAIRNITGGFIHIYITHRLGFTTMVDRVILIQDHQILEDGSFEDLMKINGKFKEMFEMQKSLYFKEEIV